MTNPRDYDPVADGFHVSSPERLKKLVKLGLMITDRVDKKLAGKLTESDPEVWALDCLLEKDEEHCSGNREAQQHERGRHRQDGKTSCLGRNTRNGLEK